MIKDTTNMNCKESIIDLSEENPTEVQNVTLCDNTNFSVSYAGAGLFFKECGMMIRSNVLPGVYSIGCRTQYETQAWDDVDNVRFVNSGWEYMDLVLFASNSKY
jgi:hypothetical protein